MRTKGIKNFYCKNKSESKQMNALGEIYRRLQKQAKTIELMAQPFIIIDLVCVSVGGTA